MSDSNSKNIAPTCPLCRNDFDVYYRTPRVVPRCGHTYCERCISNKLIAKANRKVFICPECSSQVIIRKGVQDDVPKNIGIIDVVKNLRKYSTNEKEQQRKPTGDVCSQHQRPLELVCQTCSFKKICSHCVLFGEHHAHIYQKEAPATSLNLKEVKEVYDLLSNSVKLVLLPGSDSNLRKTIKERISQGLKKSVKNNFRQYYEILEKRQTEILQQCDNIVITQGGIDNNIDKLVDEYDTIKNRYQIEWSFNIQHTNFGKVNKSISVKTLEDFIDKCQALHTKVINIKDQAFNHIETMLKSIGVRVAQAFLFKIQEMPFSLKKIIQNLGKEGKEKEITSPDKRTRMKSSNSQLKSKSVIQKDEGKVGNIHLENEKDMRNANKSQCKFPKKPKNTYSQIDKQEPADDFSLLQPGRSELQNFKEKTQTNKELKELIANKNYPEERGSLPPKASKSKISDYDSKTMNMRQLKEEDKPKSIYKDLSPAKTVSLLNKQPSIPPSYNSVDDLKFVRPTKEISFQLLSKFQQIMVQTDRQSQQNTLQLVGLDINDTLLLYLLDYLRAKKYRFQVIKLVKNVITDEGFKVLLGYLVSDSTTQLLNMTSNQLTIRSLELIVLFAQKNNTLQTIYLGGNKINAVQLRTKKAELSKYQLQIVI